MAYSAIWLQKGGAESAEMQWSQASTGAEARGTETPLGRHGHSTWSSNCRIMLHIYAEH